MSYSSRLTSKSQVTVPKDVREALGVGPGARLHFEIDKAGRVSLLAHDSPPAIEARRDDFMERLALAREAFRAQDTMPDSRMDGLEYQQWIRGDGPDACPEA